MRHLLATFSMAALVGICLAVTPASAGTTPVGAIYACYACQNTGDPTIDAALAANPSVASDGLLFEFTNTSGAAITGGVFSLQAGSYSDTFSLGAIAANSSLIYIPGIDSDGGSHPVGSLFANVGYTQDTSDGYGSVTDSSVFSFTGAQGAFSVTSGDFEPSQSYLPYRDNPSYSTSFVGQGPNGDGGCNNCYYGQIATLSVPAVSSAAPEPNSWALVMIGVGLTGALLRRARVAQMNADKHVVVV